MRRSSVYGLLICLCTVSWLRAEPWRRHTIDDSSRGADGVRLADVNQDGRLDIATGWEEGGQIRVYLQPAPEQTKNPWPAVTVGKVRSPEDAVFVDLDQDGAVDVVSCCEGRNRSIFVHWAPKDAAKYLDEQAWMTAAIPATRSKQAWMFALPLQVDNREGPDLVVGSKGAEASIGWLQAPSNPRILEDWRFRPLYSAGWIMSLQAHDVDEDGDLDVLASDRKGENRGLLWLEREAIGKRDRVSDRVFIKTHRIGDSVGEHMFLTHGNLDGDGLMDVLCAQRGYPIRWYERTGPDLWHRREIKLPPGCGTGKGVALGDVDLNARTDVVFSCENASGSKSGVRWMSMERQGKSIVWEDHEISGPEGIKFDRLELLDLDADGDLDVLTCEERANLGVIWYENPLREPEQSTRP